MEGEDDEKIYPFYDSSNYVSEGVWRPDWSEYPCFGCRNPIAPPMECVVMTRSGVHFDALCVLHKKCAELPGEIHHHPTHPHHPLRLTVFSSSASRCDLCGRRLSDLLGYRCRSCNFNIDVACEKVGGIDLLTEERRELQHHPSHPHHPLTLMRKPPFSFRCDGCGDEGVDMAYICIICEFWIHKGCASLPAVLECRHHHRLSLAFAFPEKHWKYDYKCEVCDKYFGRKFWVYFCGDCRYFVHIKCAVLGSSSSANSLDPNEGDDKGVIEFPIHANDIFAKLIVPFVTGQTGLVTTGTISTSGDSSFSLRNFHEHPLSLVSEFTRKDEEKADDDEDEKEEELKICDVCITPLSSNSTPYYECATCTYSIHSICSSLPSTLLPSSSSSNLSSLLRVLGECNYIPSKNHNITLIYNSKGRDALLSRYRCYLCGLTTNGTVYKCQDCNWMKIDVKCASLPSKVRHPSHTRHHHKPLILTRIPSDRKLCHGCNGDIYGIAYCCSDGCDFALHLRCAMLPLSVINREWDKHPLMLTFDASRDHPSDFFCELCEKEMHPKGWMYHCRSCDASFHPNCLDTGSGALRNMKLGERYEIEEIHPNHPLTYTCVTLKKHCDVCHERDFVYRYLGFECATCYYVACEECGLKKLRKRILC